MAGAVRRLLTLAAACALCAAAARATGAPETGPGDTRPPAADFRPPLSATRPEYKPEPKAASAPKTAPDQKPPTRLTCPAPPMTVKAVQAAAAAAAGAPVQTTNSIGMKLVLVPAGRFMMGSPADEPGRNANDEAQHPVQIPSAFYMGVCRVTEAQYQKVMGAAPAGGKGPRYPVVRVSWNDAMEFCRKLSAAEGKNYRLPTEAEWEYACRAGSQTRFPLGDDASAAPQHANVPVMGAAEKRSLRQSGAPAETKRAKLLPTGQFAPNALGIHDMIGHAWDWCQSLKKDYPYSADDGREDLSASGDRVLRGGSWCSRAECCRSAARYSFDPAGKYNHIGFRVVMPLQ